MPPTDPPPPQKPKSLKLETILWNVFLMAMFAYLISSAFNASQVEIVPYSTFLSYVQQGQVDNLSISTQQITGKLKGPKGKQFITVRVDDPQLASRLTAQHIQFQGTEENNFLRNLFSWVIPPIIFFGIWFYLIKRAAGTDGMSAGLLPIEKSKAKVYMESNIKVTFQDVAGVDEAKEELKEVIRFLKEPERYNRLGGRLPKGILLVGPPGTGKTLLARAVAGEAGVPFFSISGSEFVEMFVGVGAARVRDLFTQAQKNAPCIIFIDELDALGRARGISGPMGSHDEKEQTLNQLLVEMDGFDTRHGVVLLAATNRPEILDAALLRAGRFDRHVLVDRPDRLGRVDILKVHLRNVTFDSTVNIDEIAGATPGFTGADLATLVNEGVLLATRRNADSVQMQDLRAALERVVAGLEKKNRLLNPKERKVVAYHEMGHALVSMSLPGTDPIQKVSIIPHGISALGYTMQQPTEDRFLMSMEELKNKLAVLMGGRAAETIVFEDISTGAADDLNKATEVARSMVTRYGMIEKLGPVTYDTEPSPFLGGPASYSNNSVQMSEQTAREIDCAVRELITQALHRAIAILTDRRTNLEKGASLLLAKETLSSDDLLIIVQPGAISVASEKGTKLKLVSGSS